MTEAPVVLNRRSLPHGVIPSGAAYVGRPTKWGNPFPLTGLVMAVGTPKRERHLAVVDQYRRWIQTQPHLLAALGELVGKNLVCWCAPLPCHADVLLELVNPTN
ncbi:MAG: DUF4326 domain-containing protein [Candidatus Bathyanammoxibius sp.]